MVDNNSPYTAPASDVQTDREKYLEILPAGNWKRFFNFIIDYIAMYAVIFILAVVVGIIAGGEALLRLESISRLEEIVFGIITYFIYYLFFESIFGKTVGKLITGTTVVNEYGAKPNFRQFLNRSLCRLIPFEAFSFFGTSGRGWHDKIPKTYVIDTRLK